MTNGGRSSPTYLSSVVSHISIIIYFCIEHKGTTLFLLKQSSKPVPQKGKRFKHNVYGEAAVADQEMIDMRAVSATKSGNVQSMPNIIGNKEDKEGGDETMYKSVTPRRTEAQKERMQQ